MRIMLDSTTPAVLPVNVGLVAGYVNGRYAWTAADWDRFGGVKQVRVNVTGEHGRGNCLDVETGDATPGDAPGWYDSVTWCPEAERAVYCNRSNVAAVVAAMGKRDWRLWLSTLDGSRPATFAGREVDAVQCLGASALGFNADLSVVLNDTWHAG